jgi:hypothetical protein
MSPYRVAAYSETVVPYDTLVPIVHWVRRREAEAAQSPSLAGPSAFEERVIYGNGNLVAWAAAEKTTRITIRSTASFHRSRCFSRRS